MGTLPSDLRTLSYEAYVYLYPLVTMVVTRLQGLNLEANAKPGCGPGNEFHHICAFPSADLRVVVRVNFDTLHSVAWLDLTADRSKCRFRIPPNASTCFPARYVDRRHCQVNRKV